MLAGVWAKDAPIGSEFAQVTLSGSTLTATGVAIGTVPRAVASLAGAAAALPEKAFGALRLSRRGDFGMLRGAVGASCMPPCPPCQQSPVTRAGSARHGRQPFTCSGCGRDFTIRSGSA